MFPKSTVSGANEKKRQKASRAVLKESAGILRAAMLFLRSSAVEAFRMSGDVSTGKRDGSLAVVTGDSYPASEDGTPGKEGEVACTGITELGG